MEWKPTKHSFRNKFYKSIMPCLYNIGAAIVILGAMFKLLNFTGGSMMLAIGLSTEALIFLLSAFEPKEQEIDWTRAYPELAPNYKGEIIQRTTKTTHNLTQKLDECLEQAQIDVPLLENFATSMSRFAENMASMPSFSRVNEVTQAYISKVERATQVMGEMTDINHAMANILHSLTAISSKHTPANYFSQIEEMSHTLTAMHVLYKKELANMQEKAANPIAFYDHLETALNAMETAGKEAIQFKEELASLNKKITTLNEIYTKTLTAFKG